jgi:hypothetical protein
MALLITTEELCILKQKISSTQLTTSVLLQGKYQYIISIFITNNDRIDHELEYRPTDDVSVYLAELTAIKKAVEIFTAISPSQEKNMYLCSDSLSGILSLRSPALKNHSIL